LNIFVQINSWVASHDKSFSAWSSLITVISAPLLFISLFIGYNQIRDILVLPDPSLEFVHPTSVAYKIINTSEKTAENVQVAFGIFDLDSAKDGLVSIPTVMYDYVNGNSSKGPFSWFSSFATKGHRYFGIVYIGCKGGERLRTYWIYVKHGHPTEGFYAERDEKDSYEINPGRLATDINYLESLVPTDRRHKIN